MKKRLAALVVSTLLLLIFSCPASAQWSFDSESVTADISIKSDVEIDRTPGSLLDYLTANVTFIPKNTDSQSVLRMTADPQPKAGDGYYLFKWNDPVPANPGFDIEARIKTKNIFRQVSNIPFPYIGFSDDITLYALPSETIDSDNPRIVEQASELAEGESDYYAVVFKIADWTKEAVEYDLSTLNIKATKKASYVLANRDGVCDEITTLFIALLRAVGIPGRFVAGIAYTNSPEFPEKWGAHGWAEVYFPGVGWVPFDVTYGQYGFVDPTHIILKQSIDPADPDTRYEWVGKDIEISADSILVSGDLVSNLGKIPDRIDITLDVLQKEVGIGSYNVVEASVTNKMDSYVSSFLFLSRINELEFEGRSQRAIMLRPLETKSFYWLVKVVDELDPRYTYTFPLAVSDLFNTSSDSHFYVLPGATVFSREDMSGVVEAAEREDEKKYSKKIAVNCSQEDKLYYVYDEPMIQCSARNIGNFPFKSLDFCIEDECRNADLSISQEKAFSYYLKQPEPGINKVKFSVEGDDVSRSLFYDVYVWDEPELIIDDIEYPSQIEFKQPYSVGFALKKKSSSLPNSVKLEFDAAGLGKGMEFAEIDSDKKLVFDLNSQDLSVKPNIFTISVSYQDLNGNIYSGQEEFEVKLTNVTFGQRLIIFLYDLDKSLRNLFK